MVFGLAFVPAYADDTNEIGMSIVFTDTELQQISFAKEGQTICVGVKIDNYQPICAYSWRFDYDPDLMEFDSSYDYSKEYAPGVTIPFFEDGVYQVSTGLNPSTTNIKNGVAIVNFAKETNVEKLNGEFAFYLAFTVKKTGQITAEFNREDIGNFTWRTASVDENSKYTDIDTTETNGTLNVVSTGVNLSQNEVTVDGTNGAKVQAYAFNTAVEDVTENVAWSVTPAEAEYGVSIANDGTITIDAKAKAGPYDVIATSEAFGDAGKAIATLWVSRTPSEAVSVDVSPLVSYIEPTMYVPAEEPSTRQFNVTVTDQYGDELEHPEVEWSISPACQGVSIAEDATRCGAVTVTNEAKNEITDTEGMEFTVTATYGKVQGSTTITIKRADPLETSVVIYRDGNVVTSNDTIAIPQSGSTTVEYSAKVLDQYGSEIKDPLVTWSSSGGIPDGVDVSGKMVEVTSNASTGSFTLTATYINVKSVLTVNVATIAFSGQDNAVTTAADPTYGMTWGQIVRVDDSKITASVGGQTVTGTYTVQNADDIPDAGEQTYTVLFNGGDYTNVVVKTGTVDIAPKSVTVSGITAENKEYDGSTNATIITDGATISGIDGDDDVTIDITSATGTFEDKNVGTGKTVTIRDIALGGTDAANYTLSDTTTTTTADITAKELTANVSSVSVTKEYDGTTAAGNVSGDATAETGISGETVTVNVSAGEYADKNVGTNKTVTLTLSLSGDNASNYTLSNKTAVIETASITPSSSITDATATEQNVVVGVGTFTAPKFTGVTVNGVAETVEGTVTYTIDGISNMTYEQAKAALAQKDKGSQIEVGYSFTSTDTNYVTTAQTGIITVSMVDIAFEIGEGAITVDNAPVYGATWGDIAKADGSRITAKVGEDTVTGTYTVKDASVRPGAGSASWEVLFTGTLGDKTYTDVTVQTGTVTVKQKELTITGLSAADKPYDGNTTATVSGTAVLNGVLAGDTVTVTTGTAAFDSKNAGAQTVTFSGYGIEGASASNYVLSAQPASVTATISPKPVTITGVTAENKTYDGNTTATIDNPGTINGIISPDTVTIKAGTGTFASADVGENIEVTFSGFSLTGTDSGNYTLSAQPASTTANITKANYTGTPNTVNVNVLINQDAAQTGSVSLDQFFQTIPAGAVIKEVNSTDDLVIADMDISDDGKVITYTSKANLTTENEKDTYTVTIETKNYNDIEATLTFTTVAKTPVNISGVSVTGAGKTYDGKAVSYTGTPAAKTNDGKTVTVTGTYSYVWQKADGTGLASAPKDAGSYKLVITLDDPAYIGSAEVSFTIAKAKITITAEDAEAYTGSDMPKLSYTVTGLATGEKLAKEPSVSCAADMKKAGSYVIAVSGAEVPNTNNYEETITYVSGTLEVKNRPVNIGPTYDIKVLDSAHGTVRASLGNASEGSTIRLTVTPDEGYSLANLIVRDERGRRIDVAKSGGVYRFVMPAGDVTIEAVFAQGTTVLPFTDVSTYDWFYEYVKYVYDNGIMDGIDVGVFGPGITTTRAMLVTMLYRVAGELYVSGTNDFADVAANTWYTDAVTWASKNGIVTGVDVGVFNPNGAITREQLATILYRYAEYVGEDVSARASLSRFTDTGSISAYARDAMSWAVAEGILDGRTATELAPNGECTRAEVATMIARAFG